MLKELRDRAHEDSFDKELAGDAESGDRNVQLRPGKKSKTESLGELLDQLAQSGMDAEAKERLAVSFLLRQSGSGAGLDSAVAAEFGRRLGMDLGGVRVHTDDVTSAIAQALGVTAFTVGRDIFFASGAYQPRSSRGRKVLAHEVAHVAQHRGARPSSGSKLAVGREGDRHEREADVAASRVLGGRKARVSRAEPAVRFMRQAFGEMDEPIVASGAAGLGCSAEELEHIKKLVLAASPEELARMLDGATSGQRNIIFYCIGQSDMAQEDAIKAFLRNHDNPQPEERLEIEGVNQALRATDEANRLTKGEKKSDIEAQIDETPRVATVSANSANAEQGAGPEAESDRGGLGGLGITELSSTDQQLISEELLSHETWLRTSASAEAGIEAFVTDPANFLDVGLAGAVEMLRTIGSFSSRSQAVAGARSLYGLINRDWERAWERLSVFGDGATEYARLASNIATVVDSVDVMLGVLHAVSGGIATVNSSLSLGRLMTEGDAEQIKAVFSEIAIAVTTASGVLGMVRANILEPAQVALAELDRHQRQADPSAPEQAVDLLIDGAQGIVALLGGMATTPDSGGPQDTTGSARAGAAEKGGTATDSPADLPLQDVSIQGYESSEGEASDVADDAVGIAVRDKSRDPENANIDGKKLSLTEAADSFDSKGKPDLSEDLVDDRDQQVDVALNTDTMVDGSGDGQHTPEGEVDVGSESAPLEGVTTSSSSERTTRTDVSGGDDKSLSILERYTGELDSTGPQGSGPASPDVQGRANPPTTLRFLHQVYRTLAFLTEMRQQASGTKSGDLTQSSQSLIQRVNELRSEAEARADAHRAQKQRLDRTTALVSQFGAERSRMSSSVERMKKITELRRDMPGRLGNAIRARFAEIMRIDRTWQFVSSQMAGQEQEMHAMHARQVTEARRLEVTADRANRARAMLAQADSALQAASGSESSSSGSAEVGAIDTELERYKSMYTRLSSELVAWSHRNRESRTKQS